MLLLALPCTVGIGITAEYIVPFLFGEAFLPVDRNTADLERAGAGVLGGVFPGTHRADRNRAGTKNSSRNDCGAVIKAAVNFLLIPSMQQSGAAIASVLSEIAVTTVLVWHARCSYHLAIGRNYVISLGAALAAMTAVVCWLKHLSWRCLSCCSF